MKNNKHMEKRNPFDDKTIEERRNEPINNLSKENYKCPDCGNYSLNVSAAVESCSCGYFVRY